MQSIFKCAFLAALLTVTVTAAAPAEPPRSVTTLLSDNPDKSVIYGTALDANASPLVHARVQLRNLQTRKIEQTGTTNAKGEFTFVVLPDMPYVVELVDAPGQIIAVGDVLLPSVGEIAGSVLMVPARIQPAGLFRSTMGAVVSAVAGAGVVLLPSVAPPLSPEK